MVHLLNPSSPTGLLFEELSDKGSGVEEVDNFRANQITLLDSAQEGSLMEVTNNDGIKDSIQRNGLERTAAPYIIKSNRNLVADVASALAEMEQDEVSAEAALNMIREETVEPDAMGLTRTTVSTLVDTAEDREITDEQAAEEIALSNQRLAEEFTFLQYAGQRIAEVAKTDNILDTTLTIGGLFIPGRQAIDILELGALTGEAEGLNANQLIREFAALPPSEKTARFDELIEEVDQITDNKILKSVILQKLAGFDDSDFDLDFYLDTVFTGIDVATLGVSVAGSKVLKGLNAVRTLERTGHRVTAGRLTASALDDPEVARAANIDVPTAQANALPFELEQVFPGSTDNIAAETTAEIERRVNQTEKLLDQVNFVGQSAFTDAERTAAKARFLDEFAEELDEYNQGISHTGAAVRAEARIVAERFSEFDVEIVSGGKTLETRTIRLNVDDTGEFSANVLSLGESTFARLASPSTVLRSIDENLVSRATQVEREAAKNITRLTRAVAQANRGLNRRRLKKVDDVLISGDRAGEADGIIYTPEQLMSEGIHTEQGLVKLDAEEAANYYSKRRVFDRLFLLENNIARRDLEFNGYKSINVLLDEPEAVVDQFIGYARPVNEFEEGTTTVYFKDRNRIVDVSDSEIQRGLEQGTLQRYQLRKPVRVQRSAVESEYFDSVISSNQHISDLPDLVLNRRAGYVPLVRKNANFFVREVIPASVSGKTRNLFVTRRIFDSELEARRFVDELGGEEGQFVVNSNRQIMADGNAADEIRNISNGGLYGGSRTQREILFGVEGTTPIRESATEALTRNLIHAGQRSTLNEFRLSATQKFKNTFGEFLTDPQNPLTSPVRTDLGLNRQASEAITQTQNYLRNVFNVRDAKETAFEALASRTASYLEGKPFLARLGARAFGREDAAAFRQSVHNLGSRDPASALKTASFHTQLGFFNPAQFVVQSAGSFPAISLAPQRFPRLASQYAGLRFIMNHVAVGNREVVENLAGRLASASGLSRDEFLRLVDEFDRTGIFESVKTNADYSSVLNSFSQDRSLASSFFDKGLVFFREGETFSRTYTWLFARDEYIRRTGKAVLNDFDLDQIARRALDVGLNLDRANAAVWQRGVLGVPTQYFQVFTKFTEQMLGKSLSTGDKLKILAGQIALGGPRALPYGTAAIAAGLAGLGVDFGELNEEQQATIEDGFTGLGLYYLTGERVATRTRFSLVSGITEIVERLNEEDARFWDIFLGASGGLVDKSVRALRNVVTIFTPVYEDFSSFTPDLILDAASELATVTSTWSNGLQAYYILNSHRVTDSRGNTLYRFSDDDQGYMPTVVARALGFTVSRQQAIFEAGEDLRLNSRQEAEVVDALAFAFRRYAESPDLEDRAMFQRIWNTILIRPFEDQPEVAQRIAKNFQNRVLGQGREAEIFRQLLTRVTEGITLPSAMLSPQVAEENLLPQEEENR